MIKPIVCSPNPDYWAASQEAIYYEKAKGIILSDKFKNRFTNLQSQDYEYVKNLFLTAAKKAPKTILQALNNPRNKFTLTKDKSENIGSNEENGAVKFTILITKNKTLDLLNLLEVVLVYKAIKLDEKTISSLTEFMNADLKTYVDERDAFIMKKFPENTIAEHKAEIAEIFRGNIAKYPELTEKLWWFLPEGNGSRYVQCPDFFTEELREDGNGGLMSEFNTNQMSYFLNACTVYLMNPQRLRNKNPKLFNFLKQNIIPKITK